HRISPFCLDNGFNSARHQSHETKKEVFISSVPSLLDDAFKFLLSDPFLPAFYSLRGGSCGLSGSGSGCRLAKPLSRTGGMLWKGIG
ncbi:hypothetical protein L249_5688, partial [Ophiocordyceps polyrhachis-furcata BCC 54312]